MTSKTSSGQMREKVVFEVRTSINKLVLSCCVLFILGLVIFFMFSAFNIAEAIGFDKKYSFPINISALIAVGLIMLVMILDWYNRVFTLTNRRVEYNFGIIVKSEKSIANSNIQSVKYSQWFIGSLLNYGRIIIRSAAGDFLLNFDGIELPRKRANQIQDQIRVRRRQTVDTNGD